MKKPEVAPRNHGFHRGVETPDGPALSDGQRRGSAGSSTGNWLQEMLKIESMLKIENGAPAVTLPLLIIAACFYTGTFDLPGSNA